MATNSSSAPPVLAGRYHLERRLAEGGMAEVWLATDVLLGGRQVAIKLLKPALATDPVIVERFRREATTVAGLDHPNIVRVYDTVDDNGRQAVVMQYVAGQSLRQILDERRTLAVDFTLQIAASIAAALAAAHEAGQVHRDVKPGNILLTPDGRAMLTDFGIAKPTAGGGDLTSENIMMGTAKYLSPEQVRGTKLDGRADLYSLGLVMYECLTGRVPFVADTDSATALARVQREATPVERLSPVALPDQLCEVVRKLLSKRADDRPSSGHAVQSTLLRIRRDLIAGQMRGSDDAAPPADSSMPSTPTRRPPTPPAPLRPIDPLEANRRSITANPPRTGPRTANSGGVDRDRTPPGTRLHGAPARQFQQRLSPSMLVVGGLLLAAVLLVVVLMNTVGKKSAPTASTVIGADPAATTAPVAPAVAAAIDAANLRAFDPVPGDGEEFDDRMPQMVDGQDSTAWKTQCYLAKDAGTKRGVGVVIPFTAPTTGTLNITFAYPEWSVLLYTGDTIPATREQWGAPVDERSASNETTASLSLGATPKQFAMLWFAVLDEAADCGDNPYRGGIAELTFTPAGA